MGNYYGSIHDAMAERHSGHILGFSEGIATGLLQGKTVGYNQGLDEGYDQGYQQGYDACVDVANTEIQKCMGYIRQHVADKKVMSEQIATQHALILQMKETLDALGQENQQHRAFEPKLRQCIKDFEAANQRLTRQLIELDARLASRNEELAAQISQYNRLVVFMNISRNVLQSLTEQNDVIAQQVRTLFTKNYQQQIARSMGKGTISCPLAEDPIFQSSLPQTHAFVRNMMEL
jgi:hypothetical protein